VLIESIAIGAIMFVNRDKELALIDEAMSTLIEGQRLLRTPIIEFCGVQGIGKTMLLQHIRLRCDSQQLPHIWVDLAQTPTTHFVKDTRARLDNHQPVVVILDSLDTTPPFILQEIETELRELSENSFLFVVLASRSVQTFHRTRPIARKLLVHPLSPLGRESCGTYLDTVGATIRTDIREMIFEWTGGYPLAMNVMTEAIVDQQLDPTREQDQLSLMGILSEKVINQKLLSAVTAFDLARYQKLLGLLSVPRRFNLALMQDLIEAHAPEYRFASSIAYITLPNAIEKAVSVLHWDLSRSGYCIETPVRKLFLLKLKVEQPQLYQAVHRFLAQKNRDFAQDRANTDRIHYVREFFYHLAQSEDEVTLRQVLTVYIEQMLQRESVENFLQFYEEFRRDEDLQEALSEQGTWLVISLLLRNFFQLYKDIPPELRSRFLHEVLLASEQDQHLHADDFPILFEEGMLQVVQQASSDDARKLYHELVEDEVLKVLLGQTCDQVLARIFRSVLEEGA
jgi:hypothetical protein